MRSTPLASSESRTQAWAEITYPAAGTLSLIMGWGVLETDAWPSLPSPSWPGETERVDYFANC